ncbi:MAG: class I SAM-dependent methyltransferase [Myxococcota bacterium]|nr:class I SAM-dependent methyltransferase [Myxococcota bacterium]
MFARLYTEGEGSVPELKTYYEFTYYDVPSNPLVQAYEVWLGHLERFKKTGRLLDVGCGTGLFLAVARRRGWETCGIDDCVEATEHARNHFELEVLDGDFSQITERGEQFDVVTMWDIIEHARGPVSLLASAKDVLTPGGVMGISTPNQRNILDIISGAMYRLTGGMLIAPLEKIYFEQHFLYFEPDTLSAVIERAGLEVAFAKRELTDLRRLYLSVPMRLALQTLFAVSRLTGLENRLFAIARAPTDG